MQDQITSEQKKTLKIPFIFITSAYLLLTKSVDLNKPVSEINKK